MVNMDKAFGLPSGSIRAILAICLVLSSIYCLITGIAIEEWFKTLLIAVVAFYFGKSSANGTPPTEEEIKKIVEEVCPE